MITVVHIRTAPPSAIYIGRAMPGRAASPLGNPFKPVDPNNEGDRQLCLRNYKAWLWEQMRMETPAATELQRLAALARAGNITLACWCAPKSCHGDIVKAAIEYLNSRLAAECVHNPLAPLPDGAGMRCSACKWEWRPCGGFLRALDRVLPQVVGDLVVTVPKEKKKRKAALEKSLGVVWFECLKCKGKLNGAGFKATWRWKKEETLKRHKCLGE